MFSATHANVLPSRAEHGFVVCGNRSIRNESFASAVILRMERCASIIPQAVPNNGLVR